MNLSEKVQRITKDILTKQMVCKDEKKMLVYDRMSPLASLLADGYIANMPDAEHIDFEKTDPKEITEKLLALPAGSTVVLVQSLNFRLDAFRIRLQLFNNGVGCMEHARLNYFPEEQFETYVNAIKYRGDEYKRLGEILAKKIDNAKKIEIFSKNGDILTFGKMETAKINHSNFFEQKNRGGAAVCGEVFSEAKDFSSVNGKMSICCFPKNDMTIVPCTPFTITVKKSFIFCDDPKCPEEFRTNILEKIANSEDNQVMMREAGFGLNPAISLEHPLRDVNAFERMAGFHVSLGKKHNIYRRKLHKDVIQRYHIDIFADLDCIKMDEEVIFEGGKYVI